MKFHYFYPSISFSLVNFQLQVLNAKQKHQIIYSRNYPLSMQHTLFYPYTPQIQKVPQKEFQKHLVSDFSLKLTIQPQSEFACRVCCQNIICSCHLILKFYYRFVTIHAPSTTKAHQGIILDFVHHMYMYLSQTGTIQL